MADNKPKHNKLPKVNGLVEKSTFRQLVDDFIEEDPTTAAKTVLKTIVKPAIKNLIADAAMGILNRMFYKDGRTVNTQMRSVGSSLIRTASSSSVVRTSLNQPTTATQTAQKASKISLNDLVMETRDAAVRVVEEMQGEIRDHGSISMAELFEIVSTDDNPIIPEYTAGYFGWKSLPGNAYEYVQSVGTSYKIVLPKPVQL